MADTSRESIAQSARRCADLFYETLEILEYWKLSSSWSNMRDQFGRFNIWASSIGVFAKLHASLDYRLRDVPDAKDLIIGHLEVIIDRMEQICESNARSQIKEFASHSVDLSNPLTSQEIQDMMLSIANSIDWLQRLSNTIRRAGAMRQNVKASSFPLNDSDGNDISNVLEELYRHWIRRDLPGTPESLYPRLLSTMLMRRRRILYRRSRHDKLQLQHVTPQNKMISEPSHSINLDVPDIGVEAPKLPSAPVTTISTQYTATTVRLDNYRKVVAPSRVSQAQTVALSNLDKASIPPSPKVGNNTEFVCPYCCLILPSLEAKNRDKWSYHVKRDLEPYVCLFEECDQAYDIFSSSKEWVDHMRTKHCMRWRCMAKSHEPKTFETQSGFETHMRDDHRGRFREEQLPFLAESSARPFGPTFEQCPFCGEQSEGLEDHVAHHLQYLALLSLPIPENIDDDMSSQEDSLSKKSSRQRSRSTMADYQDDMPEAKFERSDDLCTDSTRPKDPTILNTDFPDPSPNFVESIRHISWGYIPEIHIQYSSTVTEYLSTDPVLQPFISRYMLSGGEPLSRLRRLQEQSGINADDNSNYTMPSEDEEGQVREAQPEGLVEQSSSSFGIKQLQLAIYACAKWKRLVVRRRAERAAQMQNQPLGSEVLPLVEPEPWLVYRPGTTFIDPVGPSTNRGLLASLSSKIVLRPGMHRVELNLDHIGRKLVARGDLYRLLRTGGLVKTHVFLFDHYLILSKLLMRQNETTGTAVDTYDVSKLPIPMDLLTLRSMEFDEAITRTEDGHETLFSFQVKHLGKEEYTLCAMSESARLAWRSKIVSAKSEHAKALGEQNLEPFDLHILATTNHGTSEYYLKDGLADAFIDHTPLARALSKQGNFESTLLSWVNCMTMFHHDSTGNMIAMGTDSGIFVSKAQIPYEWRKALNAPKVTQIAVLGRFSLLLFISDRALLSYQLDAILDKNAAKYSSGQRVPQKLSGARDVHFFTTGTVNDRTLLFYKKKEGVSSTFKILEPLPPKPTPKTTRFFKTPRVEFLRDYDEFYIPVETYSINLFNSTIAIGTGKGFEVLTLDKKVPWAVPDLKPPHVAAIAQRIANLKPLAMLRINNSEFFCVYEECGVYINKHGDVSRSVIMEFVGKAISVALCGLYLVLFNRDFIEIRNVENGRLCQVIQGTNIRCLDDARSCLDASQEPVSTSIKAAMQHPKTPDARLIFELLLKPGI